jgi:hypothetical protein
MKKEFIPYEQALALKELGFDEPCRDHWERGVDGYGWGLFSSGDWLTYKDLTPEYKDNDGNICGEFSCPTFSQAFRWFREKYKLYPQIGSEDEQTWRFTISILGYYELAYNQNIRKEPYHKTYEEAELECSKKLIEIVKDGK